MFQPKFTFFLFKEMPSYINPKLPHLQVWNLSYQFIHKVNAQLTDLQKSNLANN